MVIFGTKEAPDRVRVTTINYVLTESDDPRAYVVSDVPDYPPSEPGVLHVLYYNPIEDKFYFEQEPRDLTEEEKLTQIYNNHMQLRADVDYVAIMAGVDL